MKKQIKRITAVAAAAALAISFTFPAELGLADLGVGGNAIVASAETSDDFEYYVEGGNVKITKYIGSGGSVDIPATIDGKPVTSIGEYAFAYYSGLTSITIPNSVISIGNYAFAGCSELTSITIPSSVTSIGNYAFGNCSGLKTIYIPNGAQLGAYAIPDTAAKITYTVDSSNNVKITEIELSTGQNTVDIPATIDGKPVTSIGERAFQSCSELTSITIPNGVTSIETGAFWGCSGLTSITIPSSVTFIGHFAFRSCYGLTSVTIPSSVTSIGISAFENCSELTTIYIPSGAQLGSDAIPDTAAKITYTVDSSTNSVTITKIELPTGQNTVNIPTTIDGKTVTAVAEEYQNLIGSHEQAHILNKTEKQAHTCTDDGNIEYWSCSLCGKKFSDSNGTNEITNIVDPAKHSLVKTDAKAHTCTDDGNIEYWKCSVCGKKFSDANGTNEITNIVDPAPGHSLVKTDAKAPTCTDDGNIEYWECSVCQKYFSDANGTNEITNIVDPAPGHSLVKTDAKAPTCTDDGNIEYWECSVCGKKFSDANGTNEITNIVDPAKHSLVKTDAKAPTCNNDGNKAYWTCTECGNIFSDDAGLNPTTLADVTISATNHSWSKDWSYDGTGHWHACSGCDKKVDFEAHTKNSGTVTIQPTATTAGVRVYFCSVCGYGIRTEIIPAMGVNYYPTYPVISTPNAFTENLTVNAEESGSTVILSWNGIKNADKYYVYQYKDRKYVKIKTTADNSVEINGLKNGVTYKFLVRYTIGGKLSPMTYSYKITVKVYYKPVVKAASTENSVRLIWKAVPNAEKYAVYKYVDGKAVKLCETEKLAVRINKLSPDTEYKYIVRAYVDGKWTAMMTSDIVTIKTKAE